MQRVYYFSGYRMTVFDFDGPRLLSSQDFQPDDSGFADFEYLLEHSGEMTSRLLVDMIEEDFRRETMPHVNFWDRSALIERMLERHYRDEVYSHARIAGRSDLGRRDDTVLLSALTNTELLSPWLDRLKAHEVQLAGIWSLPLLSHRLLKPIIQKGDEHVLIVSREVRSALRNSYFRRGSLMLSRQAKFDRDMWDRDDFEGVITNLERATIEIYNFLMNQKLMEPSDQLRVYCIMHDEQLEDARDLANDRERIHYEFVSLERLFKQFGLQNCEDEGADTLFSYLCTRENPLQDHYATRDQKSTFYSYLTNRVVSQVTEFGMLVCLTAGVLLAMSSLEMNQREEDLILARQDRMIEFNQRFSNVASILDDAPLVESTLDVVRRIEQDAANTPQAFFEPLGRVLGQPRFSSVSLSRIEWNKYEASDLEQRIRVLERDLLLVSQQASEDEYDSGYVEESDIQTRRAVMQLYGEIDVAGSSYSSATLEMRDFVGELEALPEVDRVLLIETTIDMRENARFTDQVGTIDQAQARELRSNEFVLMVVLAGDLNA